MLWNFRDPTSRFPSDDKFDNELFENGREMFLIAWQDQELSFQMTFLMCPD